MIINSLTSSLTYKFTNSRCIYYIVIVQSQITSALIDRYSVHVAAFLSFRYIVGNICYLFNTYTVQGFNSLWTPIYNSDKILFVFLFSLIMNYKNTLVLGVKQLQFAAKSKHGMKRKIGQYTKFHSISYINLRKNPYSTNLFFVKFDDTNLIRYP